MTITFEKPFRVLIADDDEEDVLLTRESFNKNNFPVVINEVSDGQHLIDFLRSKNITPKSEELPQLILLDINMPRKNGFEALQEIRQNAEFANIPVIILTTSNHKNDIEKAFGLGANCFFTKPMKIDDWRKTIKAIGEYCISGKQPVAGCC